MRIFPKYENAVWHTEFDFQLEFLQFFFFLLSTLFPAHPYIIPITNSTKTIFLLWILLLQDPLFSNIRFIQLNLVQTDFRVAELISIFIFF